MSDVEDPPPERRQVTVYLELSTDQKIRKLAKQSGMSIAAWIACVVEGAAERNLRFRKQFIPYEGEGEPPCEPIEDCKE